MIFKISDLRPLKTKRCPDNGTCLKTFCTRSAREGKRPRMLAYLVESHTLSPIPIGNGFTAAPPVHAQSSALTSTSRATITRRPLALTTSISPLGSVEELVGPTTGISGSGTTSAGTNPSLPRPLPSRPSRAALRQSFN